jgi:3-oxoacyl-[acyl-carrier protein] reductase
MDLGISGRRAAVAAASGGLGFAVADALAQEGVYVAICGHDHERIEAAAAKIGYDAIPLVCDLSTADGAEAFVDQSAEALGQIDILVANGPGPPPGDFSSTPLEAYAPALELNLLATVAMCYRGVPAMRERGWGRLVAITSIAVRQPIPQLILSNTARTGLTGFLKTLAREVVADGVTVNSLQPGGHATDRMGQVYGHSAADLQAAVAAHQLGRAEDFGRLAAVVCSEHARFLTGAAIPVDGGAYAGLQ